MGRQLFERMEAHLARRAWLVTERPTFADVAMYRYTALGNLLPWPQAGLLLMNH